MRRVPRLDCLISDIALPQALVGRNRSPRLHHVDRSLVFKIDIGNAEFRQDVLASRKRHGFADHQKRKLEQAYRTGAHRARRQRSVHDRVMKRHQPRMAQATHLAVQDHVLFLHPPVMPTRDDLLAARQHRTDRQPALTDAGFGPGNGFRHEIEMMLFYGHDRSLALAPGISDNKPPSLLRPPRPPMAMRAFQDWLHTASARPCRTPAPRVFFTEGMMVSVSSGRRVRRSITSASMPSFASSSAAFSV